MKKQITKKLTLNKETLRNLSERELTVAVGGATALCETRRSDCWCITDGSCQSTDFC